MKKLILDINSLLPEQSVIGAFAVLKSEHKITSTHKSYIDFSLVNKTGEINGKLWDCNVSIIDNILRAKMIVIHGVVREWNGQKQININKIRPLKEEDNVKIDDLIMSSVEDSKDMYIELRAHIESIKDDELRSLTSDIIYTYKDELLYYSASQEHHHSYRGGLLEHTLAMVRDAISIVKNRKYANINLDLLLTGIILHDIGKIKELSMDELCLNRGYSVSGELLGHITIIIKEIELFAEKLGINNYKKELVQHMILSHHYEPDFGSPKRPMFIEAELLHYLDMYDTKLFMLNKIQNGLNSDEFSNRQWSLDNRKIYKTNLPQL